MTSFSSRQSDRVLDTAILVYSLLQGHPAEGACVQFLRGHFWITSPLILLEAKTVLTKVYGVDTVLASQKLMQAARGSNIVIDLTSSDSMRRYNSQMLMHWTSPTRSCCALRKA